MIHLKRNVCLLVEVEACEAYYNPCLLQLGGNPLHLNHPYNARLHHIYSYSIVKVTSNINQSRPDQTTRSPQVHTDTVSIIAGKLFLGA